jgi:hypothetical protein
MKFETDAVQCGGRHSYLALDQAVHGIRVTWVFFPEHSLNLSLRRQQRTRNRLWRGRNPPSLN